VVSTTSPRAEARARSRASVRAIRIESTSMPIGLRPAARVPMIARAVRRRPACVHRDCRRAPLETSSTSSTMRVYACPPASCRTRGPCPHRPRTARVHSLYFIMEPRGCLPGYRDAARARGAATAVLLSALELPFVLARRAHPKRPTSTSSATGDPSYDSWMTFPLSSQRHARR